MQAKCFFYVSSLTIAISHLKHPELQRTIPQIYKKKKKRKAKTFKFTVWVLVDMEIWVLPVVLLNA